MKGDAPAVNGLEVALRADRSAVDRRLGELVDLLASQHDGIREAIVYSLLGGGKRLRPILCLWSFDAFSDGALRSVALDVGCAVECVHTYSLIHDDLPCMDDDDLRRGRPSSHKQFGEATAILAGDALLTLAFEIVATIGERHADVSPGMVVELTRLLSRSAGTAGLIAGQAMDMSAEESDRGDLTLVEAIHENKTARLISAAMELGAVVAGEDSGSRARVADAGLAAGLAFQIEDDVLDADSVEETLGKTPGKDLKSRKLTYPSVAGLAASRARAAELIARAQAMVADSDDAGRLRGLFDRLINRTV